MAKNNIDKQKTQTLKAEQARSTKEYLSVRDVAEQSGFSYGTVKRAIETGELAAYRIGRKFFIEAAEAADYCTRHQSSRRQQGYTIRELMGKLSLSYAFVSELIKSGELKSCKIGRQYIVSEEDFQEFMQKKRLHG